MEIHGGSKNQNTLCHVQSENMDALSMDRYLVTLEVYVVLQHILLFDTFWKRMENVRLLGAVDFFATVALPVFFLVFIHFLDPLVISMLGTMLKC